MMMMMVMMLMTRHFLLQISFPDCVLWPSSSSVAMWHPLERIAWQCCHRAFSRVHSRSYI